MSNEQMQICLLSFLKLLYKTHYKYMYLTNFWKFLHCHSGTKFLKCKKQHSALVNF